MSKNELHEFSNLLSGVVGYSRLIKSKTTECGNVDLQRYVGKLNDNVDRMLVLFESIKKNAAINEENKRN